jgi:sensor histidine kinase regulating citrate/malate metabolism
VKTNIFLLILAVFIVSLFITLNIFFQQNYQSEMAEQFNRQQLLIAKFLAKNIEGHMEHLDEETLSFVRLLADRGIDSRNMEGFVNDAFAEVREEISINLKVLDQQGRLRYSSSGESLTKRDMEFFRQTQDVRPGKVQLVDLTMEGKKVVMLTPIVSSSGRAGVLILDIMLHAISQKFLAPIKEGPRACLDDGRRTLLFHPPSPRWWGRTSLPRIRHAFSVMSLLTWKSGS